MGTDFAFADCNLGQPFHNRPSLLSSNAPIPSCPLLSLFERLETAPKSSCVRIDALPVSFSQALFPLIQSPFCPADTTLTGVTWSAAKRSPTDGPFDLKLGEDREMGGLAITITSVAHPVIIGAHLFSSR